MTTLTLPTGTVVTLHDSPRTLPESRRVEHDYYALIESGIGSSMPDIDRHFETLSALVGGEPDTLLTEINNTRFLFYNLLEKQHSAASLAFCCLVEKVDDIAQTDFSPEAVELLSRKLSDAGLTAEVLEAQWQAAKKKSMMN